MNSQQAWQAAIGQLQMDMPKASFDTWVRDTQVVNVRKAYLPLASITLTPAIGWTAA